MFNICRYEEFQKGVEKMSVVTKKIKSSLMEEVIDYRNIHLAYLRSKNNFMNREVQNYIDINLFEKSTPNLYENIYKIITGELPFDFKPLEVLNKPKKKEKNVWKKRQIVRMNFFDAVIAQCFINVLAEKIRFMLPTSNLGYKLNPLKTACDLRARSGGFDSHTVPPNLSYQGIEPSP